MHKELMISLVVIAFVVIGNVVTQNNTNKIVDQMANNLNSLREEVIKEFVSQEQVNQQMQKVKQTWEKEYETMAYYIEHDELEKVETELTKLRADIETEEYNMAVENLDNCKFILEHIRDKSALKIVNIF